MAAPQADVPVSGLSSHPPEVGVLDTIGAPDTIHGWPAKLALGEGKTDVIRTRPASKRQDAPLKTCRKGELVRMVGAAGVEPATLGLEIRCSIRLSYAPAGAALFYRVYLRFPPAVRIQGPHFRMMPWAPPQALQARETGCSSARGVFCAAGTCRPSPAFSCPAGFPFLSPRRDWSRWSPESVCCAAVIGKRTEPQPSR